MIPDSDDILSYNILNKCFYMAEENNFDMIRFNTYLGKRNIFMYQIIKKIINKSIYQPKLSSYIFYGIGHLYIIDPMISNKFIKRNVLIQSLNNIDNYYLNKYMIFYEDTLINFILHKTCKSYHYLENIGYFYILNPKSSTNSYKKKVTFVNKFIYSYFLFLKFIFDNTKNNKYEKDMANEIIEKEKNIIMTSNMFNKINKNIIFYLNIINMYLENEYINLSTKKLLTDIKTIIKKKKE